MSMFFSGDYDQPEVCGLSSKHKHRHVLVPLASGDMKSDQRWPSSSLLCTDYSHAAKRPLGGAVPSPLIKRLDKAVRASCSEDILVVVLVGCHPWGMVYQLSPEGQFVFNVGNLEDIVRGGKCKVILIIPCSSSGNKDIPCVDADVTPIPEGLPDTIDMLDWFDDLKRRWLLPCERGITSWALCTCYLDGTLKDGKKAVAVQDAFAAQAAK
ncbi:hypothetical protein BKA93DRAFT_749306 [Sparassis latifolia]